MDGKPKWMKEIDSQEDEGNVFGEELY